MALVGALIVLKVCAQTDPTNYKRADLVPASPTAANLGKYGDVPVTMYTGLPNISYPVFTVQGQDISLPISLTYNYNGCKPAEQVSWIGLGWSLQAGGVITRQIRGKIDEHNTTNPYAYENIANINLKADSDKIRRTQIFLNGMASGATYDGEPDIFSFNFPGHSGKFIQIKNKFYTFPLQKLKISGNPETGFSITTEDGTRYDFTVAEQTSAKHLPGDANYYGTYNSALYLSKITNAAQTESINLVYTNEAAINQQGVYSQSYDETHHSEIAYVTSANSYGTSSTLFTALQTMPSTVTVKRLSQIFSSKFEVDFNSESSPRTDIPGGGNYPLGNISVVASGYGLVKNLILDHGYFGNGDLKLLSVKDVTAQRGDGPLQPSDYLLESFDYVDNLPARNDQSVGTDDYGYYNGVSNNYHNLIPTSIAPNGADRHSNFNSAIAGTLTKITYPTGATTTLGYEKNIVAYDGLGAAKQLTSYTRSSSRHDNSTLDDIFITGAFHIDEAQKIHIMLYRLPKNPEMDGDDNLRHKDNNDPEATIYDSSNNVIYTGRINSFSENSGHLDSLQISAGDYELRVECDSTENSTAASVSFGKVVPLSQADVHSFRGVRLKTVTSNPVIGAPIVKNYVYDNGVDINPTYARHDYVRRKHDIGGADYLYHDYAYTLYNSSLEEGTSFGIPYFFGKVTEYTGPDTSAAFKSVYTFSTGDNGNSFMGVDPAGEYHYKKAGGGYSLVSSKEYTYGMTYADSAFCSVRPYVYMKESFPLNGDPGELDYYDYEAIWLQPSWRYLQSTTETLYNNTDVMTTISSNQYDLNTRNLIATTTTSSDGIITTQKFKYPEDYTTTVAGSLADANLVTPIEKQVWQTQPGATALMMSGSITQFDGTLKKPTAIYAFENATGISTLSNEAKDGYGKYNTLISDNHYQQKVTYLYDSYGKLTGQQLTGAPASSYQYGYHPTYGVGLGLADADQTNYPIAECKNCQPNEFFTENFEDNSTAAVFGAHTGYKYYNGNSYTLSWTAPNSRAYVISYWYKNSSGWNYSGEHPYTGNTFTMNNGTGYDDIRIYPANAQVSTYTYNTGVGLGSAIDAKGIASYYEYDGYNRLLNAKDQFGNIVKNNTYNYGAGLFGNAEVKMAITRADNTCGSGLIGDQYIYDIPAGTYIATSQAAADAQAAAELAANGQASANSQAGCVISVTISFANSATDPNATLNSLIAVNTETGRMYQFSKNDLITGVKIPQGVYNFTYSTAGDCTDNMDYGWGRMFIKKGTGATEYHNVFANCAPQGVYTVTNVDLTSVTAATINMQTGSAL